MAVSIQDVAARAGVSVSTVGRAFTNPRRVSAKTRHHVLMIAAEMGYQVSRSASALKSGQSKRVALLINETLDIWFNGSVLSGMNAVLQPAGYDVSVYERVDDIRTRDEFFHTLPLRRNADAVVVASFGIDPHEVAQLSTLNVPIVGINVPTSEGLDASISIDDRDGMRMAARHLIQLGHRDIVYLCSETTDEQNLAYSTDERVFGFEDAGAESGARVNMQTMTLPRNLVEAIDSAISQLCSLDSFPTGICCQSDSLAIPLIERLHQMGRAVPGDCSVVGFDDMALADAFGLTTIRQNPHAMGENAARKVLALIGGDMLTEAHETAATQLMARRTTAVPRKR